MLDDALKIADRCVNPADREAILKAVSDIQSMKDALNELRAQGKVTDACWDIHVCDGRRYGCMHTEDT